MKIELHSKNDLPKSQQGEYHSVDVITCDEFGVLNIAFYNFDKQEWSFHADTVIDYFEEGNETDFVWMYAPTELLTYLEQKR